MIVPSLHKDSMIRLVLNGIYRKDTEVRNLLERCKPYVEEARAIVQKHYRFSISVPISLRPMYYRDRRGHPKANALAIWDGDMGLTIAVSVPKLLDAHYLALIFIMSHEVAHLVAWIIYGHFDHGEPFKEVWGIARRYPCS